MLFSSHRVFACFHQGRGRDAAAVAVYVCLGELRLILYVHLYILNFVQCDYCLYLSVCPVRARDQDHTRGIKNR